MENQELSALRRELDGLDRELAALFERRMALSGAAAAVKAARGLPVRDVERERELLERGQEAIRDPALRPAYGSLQQELLRLSRERQEQLLAEKKRDLRLTGYTVFIRPGGLREAGALMPLRRRVLLLSDSGVPEAYRREAAALCGEAELFLAGEGEESKSPETLRRIWERMLDRGFERGDCVLALGGGRICDLGGLAAAGYMRGIDHYLIPTTLLGQLDASVGGKTAVNLEGVKNLIGAFYPPRGVLIDPLLTESEPRAQQAAGLAEAVKMALCLDAELFRLFEEEDPFEKKEEIIRRSLSLKASVTERDFREAGLRRVLNFGHTLGHGIELCCGLPHGAAVGLGMLPLCAPALRPRLRRVLEKLGLPCSLPPLGEELWAAVRHDKKRRDGSFTVVTAEKPGQFAIVSRSEAELRALWREAAEE